jgi:sigma-B regulation protein RsbU (phosphoserine phosphatase)
MKTQRLLAVRPCRLAFYRTGRGGFGYHWIDSDHFAIYLLGVCGHGVGASLLSVAAINVIRSGALLGNDFRDSSAVLSGLNNACLMEKQNNM